MFDQKRGPGANIGWAPIASDDPSELVPLDEVERRYTLRVMEAVGGNKTLAARVLGITRKTLYRKLEHYAESQRS